MTSRRRLFGSLGSWLVVGVLVFVLGSCKDDYKFTEQGAPPDSVTATVLGIKYVQLRWKPSPLATGYEVQRRTNFSGDFRAVKTIQDGSSIGWTDDSVSAETVYGYRLVALSASGDPSAPSLVVGVMTPPKPGIEVATANLQAGFDDPDGYTLMIMSAGDTIRRPMLPAEKQRFGPLAPGDYVVRLVGVASNCTVIDGVQKTVSVTDLGLQTVTSVAFNVRCRNPDLARLVIAGQTTGDTTDTDGYTLTLSGRADDHTLPDSGAVYRNLAVKPGFSANFDDLHAGSYTLELEDVADVCTVTGGATRNIAIARLADTTVTFAVVCRQPDDPTKPLIYQAAWSPLSAATGQAVGLDVSLDISRRPSTNVKRFQGSFTYDQAVVRYDSAKGDGRWSNLNANGASPGTVSWLNFVNGNGDTTPQMTLGHFYFTVVGAAGSATATLATIDQARTGPPDPTPLALEDLIRKEQATLTVASGSGGSSNQPPVARPTGPYTGAVNTAVTFNGSTSSDPDGSIAGYSWTFGDGGTGTGAVPTHTYTAAGTYTVSLTVTDNQGATNSASTTATIAAGGGGGGNLPPVARPGGPYTGTAGVAVAFNGSTSSDPESGALTYSWTFGDGDTGNGSQPTHTYATAGTYTVQLTVTDPQNATNSAGTTATIGAGGGGGGAQPFLLSGSFSAPGPDSVTILTITLDISTDITETTGPEVLKAWTLDSLKWNPAVLKYNSLTTLGWVTSSNPTFAISQGRLLAVNAIASSVQTASQNSGIITIARIGFKVIGASATTTTTMTALGPLVSTANSFSYNSKTAIQETTFTAP